MTNSKNFLDKMSKKDTYSLLMFVLFRLSSVEEYSILSQLMYLLDYNNFIKLIKYFAGQTIKVPTIAQLRELIHALVLYKDVNIDGLNFSKSVSNIPEEFRSNVLDIYDSVVSVMEDYQFV